MQGGTQGIGVFHINIVKGGNGVWGAKVWVFVGLLPNIG